MQAPDSTSLVRLFGSTSRARILALMFSRPYRPLYQREIMGQTGLSLQTIQRELANLVRLGILRRYGSNQKVYYQISQTSSLFSPLNDIFGIPGRSFVTKV